jgi:hypothetical protein
MKNFNYNLTPDIEISSDIAYLTSTREDEDEIRIINTIGLLTWKLWTDTDTRQVPTQIHTTDHDKILSSKHRPSHPKPTLDKQHPGPNHPHDTVWCLFTLPRVFRADWKKKGKGNSVSIPLRSD